MDQPSAGTPLPPDANVGNVVEQPIEDIPPLELLKSLFWEIATIVVPALALAFLIHQFVAETTVVFGQSMVPELLPRQRLVVEKVTYRFRPPQRGQLVVLSVEGDRENLIKRVVAMPGEFAAIDDGIVLIDGEPLLEPYVTWPTQDDMAPRQMGPTEFLVLGDNRPNSRDSRQFGPVDQENIVGRAWLRYWPLSAFHHFQD